MLDVIVVGAGLSGLVCASRLAARNLSVVVLEARDRVGGRLHSIPFANTTIDLGAQWMSVDQPRLAALASSLDIPTFPQARTGDPLFALPDRGFFARLSSAFARWRGARRVTRLAKAPPLTLDAYSLGDWLAHTIHDPSARALLAMHAELVFATDPSTISLLYYLRTFTRTGGFSPSGPDLPGSAREHRFVGGAQSLALALSKHLDVRLSSPVQSITQSADSITVRTSPASSSSSTSPHASPLSPSTPSSPQGSPLSSSSSAAPNVFTARNVVLAIPPPLLRKIDVDLPLPARQFASASHLGAVVKCFAAYDRPFWRDANLSGEAFRPFGDIRATVALEPPADQPAPSILLAFVVGPPAASWHSRPATARRDLVLSIFVEQFGELAASPLDYTEVDWSIDPWSTGCVASLPPNALLDGAALRAPHGRIHFAGTETAELWPGYMEGAIEAGARAADEILGGA